MNVGIGIDIRRTVARPNGVRPRLGRGLHPNELVAAQERRCGIAGEVGHLLGHEDADLSRILEIVPAKVDLDGGPVSYACDIAAFWRPIGVDHDVVERTRIDRLREVEGRLQGFDAEGAVGRRHARHER